jgi:hypothetical protein
VWKSPERANPEKDLGSTADNAVSTEDLETPSKVASHIDPTTTSATVSDKNKDQNKNPKAKQMRKFNPSWQHTFPWVKLVNKKMFCDVCMNNQHASMS